MDIEKQNNLGAEPNPSGDSAPIAEVVNPEENLQRELDDSLLGDVLGERADVDIEGIGELRPMTLATVSILKRIKSPLIDGVDIECIEDMIGECAKFVAIHTKTNAELLKLCKDPDAMELAAMDIADKVAPDRIDSFIDTVMTIMSSSVSTQVEASPPKDEDSQISDEGKD